MGGKADNGLPLFRIVRGSDRTTFIGGAWKDYDKSGNFIREVVEVREVLKYPDAKERYIFEALIPPENYGSEREWEMMFTEWIQGVRIETLGAFPRQGEYELVKVLETPKTKQFVPLTEAICDALVTTAKLNKELPQRVKYEAARERREREEKEKDQRLIDRIEDMGRPNWAQEGKPHVIVPDISEVAKYS